jgi:hypothetical protein
MKNVYDVLSVRAASLGERGEIDPVEVTTFTTVLNRLLADGGDELLEVLESATWQDRTLAEFAQVATDDGVTDDAEREVSR